MIALYSRQWSLLDPRDCQSSSPPRPKCSYSAIASRSSEFALHVARRARAPKPCEPWRGIVDASLLSIGEIDRLVANGSLW
jgi:hypothetical protein